VKEQIRADFNIYADTIQSEYHVTEPDAHFYMQSTDAVATRIEQKVAENFIHAVQGAFNGVFTMSMDMPGLVETSSNLASVRTKENSIVIVSSQRSSVESSKYAVRDTIAATFRLAGAKVESNGGYPGWTPNVKSALLKVATDTYRQLFGKEAQVLSIHAGLECGLFLINYPELDMISVGPTLRGVHSPSERLELCTVNMVFIHLLEILKNI